MNDRPADLKTQIADRIQASPDAVWTAVDFLDLGSREAVDKALQRLTLADQLRRVIQAVARRDQAPMLVDGMTAANDLGLSDAVPGRIIVHTGARLRPIKLGKQTITFRPTAPSKLFWAGRPAMWVVQALHWLRDALTDPDDRRRILGRLRAIFADPDQGRAIVADLTGGLPALPAWMQDLLRPLLADDGADDHQAPGNPRQRRHERQSVLT